MKHLERFRQRRGPPIDARTPFLIVKLLTTIKPMLSGYKTYIVGITAILGSISLYLTGDATLPDTLQACLTAILGMTVRGGVASIAK